MKLSHAEVEYENETGLDRDQSTLSSVDPRVVLEELFNLLEDYGPVWYTETHRRRALAALSTAQSAVSRRFSRSYSPQFNLSKRR